MGSSRQNEHVADLLADVASAYDTGISARDILTGPATARLQGSCDPGSSISEGLVAKGLALAPHELVMIKTAEMSGNLPQVLRNIARRRHQRATRRRELRNRLAYPTLLLCVGLLVSFFAAAIGGGGWLPFVLVVAAVFAVAYAVFLWVRSAMRNPNTSGPPLFRSWLMDLGELPYLESMHGLYGAGINLMEAHDLATRTSPVARVRSQLDDAGTHLADGSPFAEALQQAGSLHIETRQLLAAAEPAGDLEGGLERASQRRQDSFDRNSRRLVKIGGTLIVCLVYGFVIWVIFDFYLGYFDRIGAILGR